MSPIKQEGGSSTNKEQVSQKELNKILREFKKESSNLAALQNVFGDDEESRKEFTDIKKQDEVSAAAIWYTKNGDLQKENKTEIKKIQAKLLVLKKAIDEKRGGLEPQTKVTEEALAKETPKTEPKKKTVKDIDTNKIDRPVTLDADLLKEMKSLGASKAVAEKILAEGRGAALNWIFEKEQEVPAQIQTNARAESEKLLQQLNLIKLEQAGYKKEDLVKKTASEIATMAAREKKVSLADDAFIAKQFLETRISRRKIEALKDDIAIIEKAEEIAKMSVAEIREYQIQRSPTGRELDRILNPEKLGIVREMLQNKNTRIITHEKPDLDSKTALYILQTLGGVSDKEIEYVEKGAIYEVKKGLDAILLDVGGSKDIATIKKGYWETDHHFEDAWIKTSTAETLLETLNRSGTIEKIEPWMRELVTFVTEVDNMSYPRGNKEWFKGTYPKTILGLREMLSIETIVEFFKAKKSPYEPLTTAELAIEVTDKRGRKQPLSNLVKAQEYQVRKSIQGIEKYEGRNIAFGQKTYSNEFGKVLFYEPMDGEEWNIPMGSHAVYNMGYDTYVRFDPNEKFYFISRAGENLSNLKTRIERKGDKVKIVRESMIISQGDKEDPKAVIGLSEHDLVNLLGIGIPKTEATVATSIEYRTKDILNKQYRIRTTYSKQLERTQEIFQSNIEGATKNIEAIEAWMAKRVNDKSPDAQQKMSFLAGKIALLQYEKKLWEEKLAQAIAIQGKPRNEFWSLVDKSKFNKKDPEASTEHEVSSDTERIEVTAEDIAAQLEEVSAEYDAITLKLETTEGPMEETIDLVVQRYNLWKLGYFLQQGGEGKPPLPMTWEEIAPILNKENEAKAAKKAREEAPIFIAEVPETKEVVTTASGEKPKPTEHNDPNQLLTPESTDTEEHENENIEKVYISTEEMHDFIRSTIEKMFKEMSTDKIMYKDLIVGPIDTEDGVVRFAYAKLLGDSKYNIEGNIWLPSERNTDILVSIGSKNVTYDSKENAITKGIKKLALRFNSAKETISSGEESRLDTIWEKALKERFQNRVPIIG